MTPSAFVVRCYLSNFHAYAPLRAERFARVYTSTRGFYVSSLYARPGIAPIGRAFTFEHLYFLLRDTMRRKKGGTLAFKVLQLNSRRGGIYHVRE